MNLRHLTTLAVFVACVPLVHAVRPADPADGDAPAKAVPAKARGNVAAASTEDTAPKGEVPAYELKNRSAFKAPEKSPSRAPFWPIGWVKRVAAGPAPEPEAAPAPKVQLDEKSFALTSILLGSGTTPSLAVINHRAYSEGEFLHLPKNPGAPPARVRVQRIVDGAVTLQNGAQTFNVALQRVELPSRRAEQQYLDPDR